MAKKPSQVATPMDVQPTRALRTSANFKLKPSDNETPTGISITVPNMSMDLRLMLHREQSGIPAKRFDGTYHDEDLPEVYKMDEIELINFRLENAQKIEELISEQHRASKALEDYHTQRDEALKQQNQKPAETAAA